MTGSSRGRAGPYQPGTGPFEDFCRDVLPAALTNMYHTGRTLAEQAGADVLTRARSYAAMDDVSQGVLMTPFAEEVARYQPAMAPLMLKGAVAVIVRCSRLEEAHVRGFVDAGGIEAITTLAAVPLAEFLTARRRNPVNVKNNVFTGLRASWPRAWACLSATALACQSGGGRWPYKPPAAPVPHLPVPGVDATASSGSPGSVVLSGIDPRFDQAMIARMRETAESSETIWLCTSLSRVSRNLSKLLNVLEYLLAHDVSVLTASYLLRPRDAWVRRGELVPVDRDEPAAAWRQSRGLSGTHRAVADMVTAR
jgi:hypothetical protein